MKNRDIELIIDECAKVELLAGDIYYLFSEGHTQDKEFWKQLWIEEKKHKLIVVSSKNFIQEYGEFTQVMSCETLDVMKQATKKLEELKAEIEKKLPSREETFEIAYKIENMVGELHYQKFMSKVVSAKGIDTIFQKLNQDDKDHARRIKEYMEAEF